MTNDSRRERFAVPTTRPGRQWRLCVATASDNEGGRPDASEPAALIHETGSLQRAARPAAHCSLGRGAEARLTLPPRMELDSAGGAAASPLKQARRRRSRSGGRLQFVRSRREPGASEDGRLENGAAAFGRASVSTAAQIRPLRQRVPNGLALLLLPRGCRVNGSKKLRNLSCGRRIRFAALATVSSHVVAMCGGFERGSSHHSRHTGSEGDLCDSLACTRL